MQHSQNGTQALIKLLAIIGFFAVVGTIVWLAIQGVRVFPTAFSSLATIAETINDYRVNDELVIELEKTVVNSDETFRIYWSDMGKGTYRFTYACTDGIMLNVRTSEDALREVPCTDTLTLSEDALGLFLSAHSKAQRFSDISFKVTFDAEEGDVHIAEGTVTVVNATIPTKTTAQIIVDTTPALPPPHVSEVPKNPVVPAQSQPASAVTAILPTSPINNFSDLKISYLGIGTVKDGVFVTRATFDNDANAAFRFEVKNIGTKTSKNWTYTLALPGDTQYVSETQTALTPGERAVFTVGFEPTSDTKTSVKIGGTIKTDGDANTKNNSFEWSVKVTD